jgi:hypothetical protein
MSGVANIPKRGTIEYLEYLEAEITWLENSFKDKDYLESETRAREKQLSALQAYQLSPGALVSESQHRDWETHKWTWYDNSKVGCFVCAIRLTAK